MIVVEMRLQVGNVFILVKGWWEECLGVTDCENGRSEVLTPFFL